MVVAQASAVGVERQFADARNQIAVGNKPPALPFLAKAKVLNLHHHGDRKAVVDRGVFDVGGLDPGLGKGRRPRPDGSRISEVDLLTHLLFWSLACADGLDQWP